MKIVSIYTIITYNIKMNILGIRKLLHMTCNEVRKSFESVV